MAITSVGRRLLKTPRCVRNVSNASEGPSTRFSAPIFSNLATPSAETSEAISRASEYLLPVYARPNLILSHGKGSYIWDTEGRKFLDFSAGIAVNALGHGDAGFIKTFHEQTAKILHTSNVYHNEWAPRLAELLVTLTQNEGGLGYASGTTVTSGAKVFFSNSGTEANEGALKIARKIGKDRWASSVAGRVWDSPECNKTRIVAFENAFHGRSMGALSVTINPKYQKPFAPLLPGIDIGKINVFEGLHNLVNEDTCAVIVEPIQGEGGINTADVDWLVALRKRCDQVGAVLIYDEIQCGLYRTGSIWAHSTLPTAAHPDIITMAKPLANGYPIGAVLMRDSIAETMTAGTHGTTFGGSPLACALGHHVLSRLSNQQFVEHVKEMSAYLDKRLQLLPTWFPEILEDKIRGQGFIRGLGFKDVNHPGQLVEILARERGVLFLTAGKNAVRIVPSLTVGMTEIDLALDVLESCLGKL